MRQGRPVKNTSNEKIHKVKNIPVKLENTTIRHWTFEPNRKNLGSPLCYPDSWVLY